ncbi:protein spaetzle 3-like [Amphibalanus amphitrite]|uniref:protein spaetzle 3-like n=1 Tax=Amphibalanus amphitrite TaxID=1232801 RepID=UPI001C9069C1|nr:protein spaetzle 3-like [Amphibalanus amphitrite]
MKTLLVLVSLTLLMVDRGRSFSVADLPCVQRLNQLYCKHQGPLYPAERIDQFIDLNKALTLRMFGEEPPAEVTTGPRPSDVTMAPPPSDVTTRNVSMAGSMMPNTMPGMRRFHTVQRVHYSTRTSWRGRRSANETVAPRAAGRRTKRDDPIPAPPTIDKNSEHRVDSCESRMEIMTPFWAENSAKEVRVIVNTKNFPQAIRVEICTRPTTSYCRGNCLCEQKYTWYRLLAYDPDNDCKGIFIDWFLYPSCCACRCKP